MSTALPYRINTVNRSPNIVGDYVRDRYICTKFGENPIHPRDFCANGLNNKNVIYVFIYLYIGSCLLGSR